MMKNVSLNAPAQVLVATLLLLGPALLTGGAMSKPPGVHLADSVTQSANDEEKQLLRVIRDEWLIQNEPERVLQAIKRLGELKSTEAINDLIRLLTLRRVYESERMELKGVEDIRLITPGERYPATDALIEIGMPALPALVEAIEQHDTSALESENARYAVMIIFRDSPGRAVEYIRKAEAEASSPEAAKRLSYAADKAAEIVKKLPPR